MHQPRGDDEKIFDMDRARKYQDEGDAIRLLWNNKVIRKERLTPFGVLDPATGQTRAKKGKKGDFAVILTGLEDERGRMFVDRDYQEP